MTREKEIREKIKRIEEKINFVADSCSALQQEEFQSYEQDRMYLNLLKEELKKIEKK
jgi:hypothetical protein